jgi:hypothetical protein
MDLAQLEWIKTELMQRRYGLSKIQGPRGENWKLPGALLRKPRGIYIIMYINSGIYLQRTAGGFMCKKWGFLMGFSGRLTRHRNRSKYFTFA